MMRKARQAVCDGRRTSLEERDLSESRIPAPAEVVRTYVRNMREHRADEANARMLGSLQTQYGHWWNSGREPGKRPFYEYGPSQVAIAIGDLTMQEAKELQDELRSIRGWVTKEYLPAAEAAKKKLGELERKGIV
jgi:hypothetical protein